MIGIVDLVSNDTSPTSSNHAPITERMFRVHIEKISRRLITYLGVISILIISITRPLDYLLPVNTNTLLYWRSLTCLFLGWPVIAFHFSKWFRRHTELFFTVNFVGAAFVTGYLLMPITEPASGLRYLVYIVPLWTIVTPSKLWTRFLITLGALAVFPGAYLSMGWSFYVYGFTATIMTAMILISVVIGHSEFYRLEKENFFNRRRMQIQQQKIKRLAAYDQLTGLYDRHHLEERMNQEFSRASRHNIDLCLLMIDLDHFKQINDEYGHPAGDAVLERIGGIINSVARNNMRQSDIAGRYGGEEFCVLLPETKLEGAHTVAERIRKTFQEETFISDQGEEFTATCSIGISEYTEELDNHEDLVKKADDALYQAKEKGRNRVLNYLEYDD